MRSKPKTPNNYAFIDSQNLNLGTQKMGWKLNWSGFRRYLEDEYGVTKAYLFIGYLPENEAMYNQLHESGYLIVLKPTVGMYDDKRPDEKPKTLGQDDKTIVTLGGSKEYKTYGEQVTEVLITKDETVSVPVEPLPDVVKKPAVKGNIDAELVLYAMKEINNYNKAIIVSGDGDFYCLVEYLAGKNKLLHLITPNWQYSSLLKPYEQYILQLDKQRSRLAYRGGKKRVPKEK